MLTKIFPVKNNLWNVNTEKPLNKVFSRDSMSFSQRVVIVPERVFAGVYCTIRLCGTVLGERPRRRCSIFIITRPFRRILIRQLLSKTIKNVGFKTICGQKGK